MSRTDLQLSLVHSLLAAPGSPEGWQRFMEQLCGALHGSAAKFIAHRFEPNGRVTADVAVAVNTDPKAVEEYQQYWCTHDPWRNAMPPDVEPGAVLVGDEVLTRHQMSRTPFYNDFGRRYDTTQCLAGFLEMSPQRIATISLNRSDSGRRFDDHDVALLGALMPHLRRALQLHRRITVAEAVSNDFAGVLEGSARAVFLVNAAGKVTWMNGAAKRLSAARDGLVVDSSELRAARGADTTRFRALLAAAAATSAGQGTSAGGALALGRPTGRRPLMALVAPLPPRPAFFSSIATAVAIVIVTDPERVVISGDETLRMLFGLTAAEAALTRLLAQGVTVTEAAARLELRVDTIRTRLKTIFEKTGTHRQADLVRLVLLGSTQL